MAEAQTPPHRGPDRKALAPASSQGSALSGELCQTLPQPNLGPGCHPCPREALAHPGPRGSAFLHHEFKVRCEVLCWNSSGSAARSCLLEHYRVCWSRALEQITCYVSNSCLQLPLLQLDMWTFSSVPEKGAMSGFGNYLLASLATAQLFVAIFWKVCSAGELWESKLGNSYHLLLFLCSSGRLPHDCLSVAEPYLFTTWTLNLICSCCSVVIFKHNPLTERSLTQNHLILWFCYLILSLSFLEPVITTSVRNIFFSFFSVHTSYRHKKVCMSESSTTDSVSILRERECVCVPTERRWIWKMNWWFKCSFCQMTCNMV